MFYESDKFKHLCVAEIEAKEACDWLRAAGFPSTPQLFEGNASPHQNINLENLPNVIAPSCKTIVRTVSREALVLSFRFRNNRMMSVSSQSQPDLGQTQDFNVGCCFRYCSRQTHVNGHFNVCQTS